MPLCEHPSAEIPDIPATTLLGHAAELFRAMGNG